MSNDRICTVTDWNQRMSTLRLPTVVRRPWRCVTIARVASRHPPNKYECTIDQELTDAAASEPGRRFVFIYQVAALFCVKWRHGFVCWGVWRPWNHDHMIATSPPTKIENELGHFQKPERDNKRGNVLFNS